MALNNIVTGATHFEIAKTIFFDKTRLSRPAGIRFSQFEVCGTCDYVAHSRVTSFGVWLYELQVV